MSKPTTTIQLMEYLAQDEQREMVDTRHLAKVFDVEHDDVVYLLAHQSEMGRVSSQPAPNAGLRGKQRPRLVRINEYGLKWLSEKKQ